MSEPNSDPTHGRSSDPSLTYEPPATLQSPPLWPPPAHDSGQPQAADPTARRAAVPARTRGDFWLDAAILVGFTLAYSFGFTGLALHEWLGLGLGLVLLVHLTLHWDWVIRTTRRMFTRRGRDRFIWLVNLLLLTAMTLCVASGILISSVALPALGLHPAGNDFWDGMHTSTATFTVVLVPVHAALRWRWIVSVARRLTADPLAGPR
jgi:Domain of unknown function (DUF4405)